MQANGGGRKCRTPTSSKEGFQAFGRRGSGRRDQNFADDVRWENPEAPQLPNNGVNEGKDAVKNLFADTLTSGSPST